MKQFDTRHAAIKLRHIIDQHDNAARFEAALDDRRDVRKRRLIDALKRLPVLPKYRNWVPDGADYILDAYDRSSLLQTPLGRNGGAVKARKDLKALATLGEKLHSLVTGMNRDTLSAIGGDHGPEATALAIQRSANEIMSHSLIGLQYLRGDKGKADPPAEKKLAKAVTIAAIYVYEGLTDHRATRRHENESKKRSTDTRAYGPTRDFLRDVYDVLGINAQPEGQLRAILPALPDDDLRPKAKAPKSTRGKTASHL